MLSAPKIGHPKTTHVRTFTFVAEQLCFFFTAASYMCCTHTHTILVCVWAFSFIFRYIPKAQCKIVYSYITSESIQELLARYTEARNSTDGQTDTQIKQKYNIYFEYGKAVDATLVSMIIPVGWLDGRVLLACIVFVFTGQIRKILFKYLRSLHATDEKICYASVPTIPIFVRPTCTVWRIKGGRPTSNTCLCQVGWKKKSANLPWRQHVHSK